MTDTGTCERCSHLRSEHKGTLAFTAIPRLGAITSAVVMVRGYCHCCDCPEFVPEPDDEGAESAAVLGLPESEDRPEEDA